MNRRRSESDCKTMRAFRKSKGEKSSDPKLNGIWLQKSEEFVERKATPGASILSFVMRKTNEKKKSKKKTKITVYETKSRFAEEGVWICECSVVNLKSVHSDFRTIVLEKTVEESVDKMMKLGFYRRNFDV